MIFLQLLTLLEIFKQLVNFTQHSSINFSLFHSVSNSSYICNLFDMIISGTIKGWIFSRSRSTSLPKKSRTSEIGSISLPLAASKSRFSMSLILARSDCSNRLSISQNASSKVSK